MKTAALPKGKRRRKAPFWFPADFSPHRLSWCWSRAHEKDRSAFCPDGSTWLPGAALALGLLSLVALAGCTSAEEESLRFTQGPAEVEVIFRGEVDDRHLFGATGSVLDHVHPLDSSGAPRGHRFDARPGWLHFEYRIDNTARDLLVAKRPVMNGVSWDDIARAGAALGDGSLLSVEGAGYPQDARAVDAKGREYRLRLLTCGGATFAEQSEWNLLIGAVHAGDMDFSGDRYGWIRDPYRDEDLKVGQNGALTWCEDSWRNDRVARGYFHVSRFHAAAPHVRTDRLYWRPVLERVREEVESLPLYLDGDIYAPIRWSPSKRVGFAGTVPSAELFGENVHIAQMVGVEGGDRFADGAPDWLRFLYQGRTLLVAARPVKSAVSWDAIARAGAARGDGAMVRVGWRRYRQNAEVQDLEGNRYRVRLLSCGRSTLDHGSEWNALIGGVHRGDGDFRSFPEGSYGWLEPALGDADLGVGAGPGAATWCQETIQIKGKTHGVNRGYLVISRFHATETHFTGAAFGWRPVLEAVP